MLSTQKVWFSSGSPLHDGANFCTAEIFDLNDRYVLSSLPPACVLVEYDQPTGLSFQGLAPNVHPFFPRKHSGEIKDLFTERGVSVRRCQVSQTPAFAITDYKAQGHTMEELEVDTYRFRQNDIRLSTLQMDLVEPPITQGDEVQRFVPT